MDPCGYKHLHPIYEEKIDQIVPFAEDFLRFIPRSIPDFPSHGADHSINIIDHIDSFIDSWNLLLTDEEIYLLYLGAWFHDIGNLVDRTNHHIHSMNIIQNSQVLERYLGKKTQRQLGWIVKAHSSKCEIMEVPLDIDNVRLRLISSILRIADACEILYTKCPMEVYQIIENKMPPDSKEYWEAHRSVVGISFNNPFIRIFVDDNKKCTVVTSHITEEITSVKKVLSSHKVTIPKVKVILV